MLSTQSHAHFDTNFEILHEFEPMTNVISAIRQRVPRGFSYRPDSWTCIDVSDNWLVVGSTGIVYLYNRRTGKVEHSLSTLSNADAVTRVKVRESVDTVIAVGNEHGMLFIFQLSYDIQGIPSQKLKAYQVQGMHHSQVTCLEWSANGMKLLSADDDGVVVCTDFDYNAEQCCSYLVCKEPHRAVQLSYSHRLLLLSTRSRSVVCNVDEPLQVKQIGQRSRKVLGTFGATFMQNKSSVIPMDMHIYAARPGLRLWKAEADGTVVCTLAFSPTTLQATNSKQVSASDMQLKNGSESDAQFGMLRPFGSNLLLSYTDSTLLLLDPSENGRIVFSRQESIADLAVNGDEVFILRKCSDYDTVPLVRLAQQSIYARTLRCYRPVSTTGPCPLYSDTPKDPNPSLSYTHTNLSGKLFGALKDYGSRLVSPPIVEGISAMSSNEPVRFDAATYDAELAQEASSLLNFSSIGCDDVMTENIPVVKLEPGEIAEICIASSPADRQSRVFSRSNTDPAQHGRPTVSWNCLSDDAVCDSNSLRLSSESVTAATTKSCESAMQEDIVFSSCAKRKIKKLNKSTVKTISPGTSTDTDMQNMSMSLCADTTVVEKQNIPMSLHADATVAEISRCAVNTVAEMPHILNAYYGYTAETGMQGVSRSTVNSFGNKSYNIEDDDSQKLANLNAAVELDSRTSRGSKISYAIDVCEFNDSHLSSSSSLSLTVDELNAQQDKQTDAASQARDTLLAGSSSYNQSDPELIDCVIEGGKEMTLSRRLSEKNALHGICKPCQTDTGLKEHDVIHAGQGDGAKFHTEKSAIRADDFETYATALTNRRSPQFLSTTFNSSKTSANFNVTLTSPYEDFHSIYAGNSESTSEFAVNPAADTQCAMPSAIPPVYLPNSDAWVEVVGPANAVFPLQSLCVSRKTAWCVDRSDRLFHAILSGPGVQWVSVDHPAQLLSCSSDGHIIWKLHGGSAYAAAKKVGVKAPAGLEWREVARDVAHLCVDNNVAWYVKSNGDVMMQKELSHERTSYRSIKVPCGDHILMVVCRGDVVWALNDQRHLLVRVGVQKGLEEGSDWCHLDGFGKSLPVSSFEVDADRQVVWAVDTSGDIWFTSDVKSSQPQGSGQWFQISTTGFVGLPVVTKRAVKSLMELPQKLVSSSIQTSVCCGLVSASANGVWVFMSAHTVFNVCHSSIIGHHWELATPSSMLSSTRWWHLSATNIYDVSNLTNCCLLWLQQQNGSVFRFTPSVATDDGQSGGRITEIGPPASLGETILSHTPMFSAMCATSDALWGLMPDGRLFVRAGMTSHCPTGVEWIQINLSQFGSKQKLVHIAVGLHNVWAVDSSGCVHLRTSVRPSSDRRVNATWVQVPPGLDPILLGDRAATRSQLGSAKQVSKIFAGPNDWMIWAIDSKHNIYVREGITDALPVGTCWTTITGVKAETICVSNQFIYAISSSHDCLVRHGITSMCPEGEYWKKIPGSFMTISSAAGESLWALDSCGQLHRRYTHCIEWKNIRSRSMSKTDISMEKDWEVV